MSKEKKWQKTPTNKERHRKTLFYFLTAPLFLSSPMTKTKSTQLTKTQKSGYKMVKTKKVFLTHRQKLFPDTGRALMSVLVI